MLRGKNCLRIRPVCGIIEKVCRPPDAESPARKRNDTGMAILRTIVWFFYFFGARSSCLRRK